VWTNLIKKAKQDVASFGSTEAGLLTAPANGRKPQEELKEAAYDLADHCFRLWVVRGIDG